MFTAYHRILQDRFILQLRKRRPNQVVRNWDRLLALWMLAGFVGLVFGTMATEHVPTVNVVTVSAFIRYQED